MSFFVVSRPKENRRAPLIYSVGTPIAFRTWDGSTAWEVQAEPLPAEMPYLSNSRSKFSLSKLGTQILMLLARRLANNISICVPNLDSENLLLELDKYGISAGSGSACTSHAVEPSHVLKAICVPTEYISGALRFSLGRETTKKDIDYLVRSLVKIIADITKRYARLR